MRWLATFRYAVPVSRCRGAGSHGDRLARDVVVALGPGALHTVVFRTSNLRGTGRGEGMLNQFAANFLWLSVESHPYNGGALRRCFARIGRPTSRRPQGVVR